MAGAESEGQREGPEPAPNRAPSGPGELGEAKCRTVKLDQVEAEGGGDVGRLSGDFRSNIDIIGCPCGWRRRQWQAGNDGV